MLTTLYIIITLIIFSLNMFVNIAVLAVNKNEKFPLASFIATIVSIVFVIWGIALLVAS